MFELRRLIKDCDVSVCQVSLEIRQLITQRSFVCQISGLVIFPAFGGEIKSLTGYES